MSDSRSRKSHEESIPLDQLADETWQIRSPIEKRKFHRKFLSFKTAEEKVAMITRDEKTMAFLEKAVDRLANPSLRINGRKNLMRASSQVRQAQDLMKKGHLQEALSDLSSVSNKMRSTCLHPDTLPESFLLGNL